MKTKNVYNYLIIGGGISGISAAYYLQKGLSSEKNYALLESSNTWGGKINTITRQFQNQSISFETGADCLISTKPWAIEFIEELGLKSELVAINKKNTLIYHNRKLKKLPDGLMLLVPTKIWPFAVTSLLSLTAKIRVLGDFFIASKKDAADESVTSFINRRMGGQMLSSIIEPLVGTIFGANPKTQSMQATFPHFVEMEKKNRSLLLSVIKNKFKTKAKNVGAPFYSFRNGMGKFIELAVRKLHNTCYLNSSVTNIESISDGKFKVVLADNSCIYAEKIIVTLPAPAAACILKGISPETNLLLKNIRHASTVSVTLLYRKELLKKIPESNGILTAQSENTHINAISFDSHKFNNLSSGNFTQIKVSLGGYRKPEINKLTDQQLLDAICNELKVLLNIHEQPLFSFVKRWDQMMPQYDVGHLLLIEKIKKSLPTNIYLSGASYSGSSIPDCVFNSKKLAAQLLSQK